MKMKIVKIRIKCTVCGKFDKTIDIGVNEHGYFSIPDAHCPECLSIMIQELDHHKKEI